MAANCDRYGSWRTCMFDRTSNAYAPIAIAANIEAAARRCDGEQRGSHPNETRARDSPCCEPPSALAYIDESAHREISFRR